MNLSHLSLFTGIGGLDLAAEWAGFETIGQCEWADYPTRVLEKHWPDVPRWRDIRTLTKESFYERTGQRSVTVVSGGFPCQPHSSAGKRLASHDVRDLWSELLRVYRDTNARWLVGENVRGLLSSENGRFFGRMLRDLDRLGCHVWWYCFPASAIGTPFCGDRTVIVASAHGIGFSGMDKVFCQGFTGEYMEDNFWRTRYFQLLPFHVEWAKCKPNSGIHRNDDGLSSGLDRLKCLGNAVVPQQFYPIFRAIAEMEMRLEERPMELKLCPFCGREAVLEELCGTWYVRCTNCGIGSSIFSDPQKAVERWNRRYEPPNEPLTLKELREMGGEPYWHVGLQKASPPPHWNILDPFCAQHIEDYGYERRWLAYRRKPKETQT